MLRLTLRTLKTLRTLRALKRRWSAQPSPPQTRRGRFSNKPAPLSAAEIAAVRAMPPPLPGNRARLAWDRAIYQMTVPDPDWPKRFDPMLVPVGDLDDDAALRLLDRLGAVAQSADIDITKLVNGDGAYGVFWIKDRDIELGINQSLSSGAATLAHELGHAFDPWIDDHTVENMDVYGQFEMVAQMAAATVCAEHGFDLRWRTDAYVLHWCRGGVSPLDEVIFARGQLSAAMIFNKMGIRPTYYDDQARRLAQRICRR